MRASAAAAYMLSAASTSADAAACGMATLTASAAVRACVSAVQVHMPMHDTAVAPSNPVPDIAAAGGACLDGVFAHIRNQCRPSLHKYTQYFRTFLPVIKTGTELH